MTDQDADKLRDAFVSKLGGTAAWERVAAGRYRMEITTPTFDDVSHRERQNRAWAVVDETLDADTALGITLILPFAPADFDEARQLRELEAYLAG